MIEKLVKLISVDDKESYWPADCNPNLKLKRNLSFSKMKNEVFLNQPHLLDS